MKTTRFTLLALCLTAFLAFDALAQLKVVADGSVGIATTTPARPLEVVGQIMSTNFNTYPQNKQSNFLMRHFDQTETHFAYFNASSDANNNQVLFGGGAGSQYAATNVAFLTAANNQTLLGTERMRVNNQGRVRIDGSAPYGAITHDLTVYNTAAKDGGGEWAAASDRRVKQDIKPFEDGLEQIMAIKPVWFRYKADLGFNSERTHVGVIAQEMQKVAPYTVEEVDFTPEWDSEFPAGTPASILSYDGTAVKYMLVNAIQEQQAMIEERDDKIADLEARLERLEALLGAGTTNPTPGVENSTDVVLSATDAAVLKQNQPNPFSQNTTIEYALPRSVSSASMRISNVNGVVVRVVELQPTPGAGTLNVKTNDFPAGEYIYSLIVDGKLVDSKKMLLTN